MGVIGSRRKGNSNKINKKSKNLLHAKHINVFLEHKQIKKLFLLKYLVFDLKL